MKVSKVLEAKTHATYSASGSERWLSCPGSIPLSRKAPTPKSSKAADEGTEAHACLEFLVKNRKKRKAAIEFLRKTYSEEMIMHAEGALDYILARAKELDAEILVEIRADLPVSEPDQYGTSDIVLLCHFGRLVVIDYKYGRGKQVFPKKNSQLIYYALGVAHLYDYNFSEVELVVIQPRSYTEGLDTVRSWETTIDELLAWRDIFEEGIKRSKAAEKNPEKHLKAGDHCQFCPAQVICPELKNKSLRQAQVDFADDDLSDMKLPVASKKIIHVQNLATILPALDRLETWIKSVRDYAEDQLTAGAKIQGYALVPKRGSRQWKDIKAAEELAIKKFGNSMKLFEPVKLLSPAQFEKLGEKQKQFVAAQSQVVSSGLTLGEDKAAKDFDEPKEVRAIVCHRDGKKKKGTVLKVK